MADNNENTNADTQEEMLASREAGKYLPPLHRLKMPETKVLSTKIRWLHALNYQVKDISKGLGLRYQMVRNIITTIPKRAAREDLPPLVIELVEMADVVDQLLGDELERTHREAAKQAKRTRQDTTNNTDLDDENYHEE